MLEWRGPSPSPDISRCAPNGLEPAAIRGAASWGHLDSPGLLPGLLSGGLSSIAPRSLADLPDVLFVATHSFSGGIVGFVCGLARQWVRSNHLLDLLDALAVGCTPCFVTGRAEAARDVEGAVLSTSPAYAAFSALLFPHCSP